MGIDQTHPNAMIFRFVQKSEIHLGTMRVLIMQFWGALLSESFRETKIYVHEA